jgi:hypothetical protein
VALAQLELRQWLFSSIDGDHTQGRARRCVWCAAADLNET